MRQLSKGSTRPFACSINAVLKCDCDEAPQGTYNELVAVRLAQTLHVPIANGLMTDRGGEDAFASLHIGHSDVKLPPIKQYQHRAVAYRYPEEVAALTAFDIFIGNVDRHQNFIASLVTAYLIFGGIDHGMSLLNVETEPTRSLARLRSRELIVNHHPFYQLVEGARLTAWAARISAADPRDIQECCRCTTPVGSVPVNLQQELAEALLSRQRQLPEIISINLRRPIAAT